MRLFRSLFGTSLVVCGLFLLVLQARAAKHAKAIDAMLHAPHMLMTMPQAAKPNDRQRADVVLAAAQRVIARYPTPEAAEAAGYRPWFPNAINPETHYVNHPFTRAEYRGRGDLDHPGSILFRRDAEGKEHAVGVMYSLNGGSSQEDLDKVVPLSVASWHRHVNFCVDRAAPFRDQGPRFGFNGSIATAEDCKHANGWFLPAVFGWMIHVYPDETDPTRIWGHSMSAGEADNH